VSEEKSHDDEAQGAAGAGPVEAANEKGQTEERPGRKRDPVRLLTWSVLAAAVLVFAWYVAADRHAPFTNQARIEGYVVPMVPQVSGYLTEIPVRLHQVVHQGDRLAQIDTEPFDLALRSAVAQLADAGQQVGGLTAAVESAAGRLGVARAQLENAQLVWNRVERLRERNPGALSQADRDSAESALAQARAQVLSAEADLAKAQAQLGPQGPDNPLLLAATAAVEQAQLNLQRTVLQAPLTGVVESLWVDVGHHAAAGQPLLTLVSTTDVWIVADLRENQLAHVAPGVPVDLVLDVAPGRIFRGVVRSVGYGIDTGQDAGTGDLPSVKSRKGWLRDPQRFPVVIGFADDETVGLRRVGGQVDVSIYTGDHSVLNAIARLRLRVVSWLSFVR
jgi:multidrug resistance efflux pump